MLGLVGEIKMPQGSKEVRNVYRFVSWPSVAIHVHIYRFRIKAKNGTRFSWHIRGFKSQSATSRSAGETYLASFVLLFVD